MRTPLAHSSPMSGLRGRIRIALFRARDRTLGGLVSATPGLGLACVAAEMTRSGAFGVRAGALRLVAVVLQIATNRIYSCRCGAGTDPRRLRSRLIAEPEPSHFVPQWAAGLGAFLIAWRCAAPPPWRPARPAPDRSLAMSCATARPAAPRDSRSRRAAACRRDRNRATSWSDNRRRSRRG